MKFALWHSMNYVSDILYKLTPFYILTPSVESYYTFLHFDNINLSFLEPTHTRTHTKTSVHKPRSSNINFCVRVLWLIIIEKCFRQKHLQSIEKSLIRLVGFPCNSDVSPVQIGHQRLFDLWIYIMCTLAI